MNKLLVIVQIIVLLAMGACCKDEPSPDCIDPSRIKSDVACITLYDPVCGCNNITYSNECLAEISGVTSWTAGACGD